MKILEHQVKAIKIYKRIQRIKKDFFERLEKQGHFKNLEKAYSNLFKIEKIDSKTANILKQLIANPPNISEDDKLKQVANNVLMEFMEKIDLPDERETEKQMTLMLTSDGDLYREPREKYCYHMDKKAKRLAILKMLEPEYKSTDTIRIKAKITNNKAVRKHIGDIRQKAQNYLKLRRKLIESNGSDGYRINRFYKLIKK